MRPAVFGNNGWYPTEVRQLESMFNDIIFSDSEKLPAKALIAPHAGYLFSLNTAAKSYNHLDSANINKIILLGVSHSEVFGNRICYTNEKAFSTPLGIIKSSEEDVEKLISLEPEYFFADEMIHLNEHSLEMQFPLIKKYIGEALVMPLLFSSDAEFSALKILGELLSLVIDVNTLLVVSTDLSHFPTLKNAEKIDRAVIDSWQAIDPLKVYSEEKKWQDTPLTSCGSCGVNAVCAAFSALQLKYEHVEIARTYYSNSYAVTKDQKRVVGYGSAVIV